MRSVPFLTPEEESASTSVNVCVITSSHELKRFILLLNEVLRMVCAREG